MIALDTLMPAFEGYIPTVFTTASRKGELHTVCITEVQFISSNMVAISNQFMNTSLNNLRENPKANLRVINPQTLESYNLEIVFQSETIEDDDFEKMKIKLEHIASLCNMESIFKLKSALIFEVTDCWAYDTELITQ